MRMRHVDASKNENESEVWENVSKDVCSGSVVVTAYDSESDRPESSPEWRLIYYEALDHCTGLTRAFIPPG